MTCFDDLLEVFLDLDILHVGRREFSESQYSVRLDVLRESVESLE